ncbi:hypothetical protein [Bacillus phage YungSlug]|nr:hypothetical protein [Bacillus phage YungSlug]
MNNLYYTHSQTAESFQKLTLVVCTKVNSYTAVVFTKPATDSELVINELFGQRSVKVIPHSCDKSTLEKYIQTRHIVSISVQSNCKEK